MPLNEAMTSRRAFHVFEKLKKWGGVRRKEEVFRGRKGRPESFSNRAGWLNITLEGAGTNTNTKAVKNVPGK